ncbi:hypothetical protein HOLleu_37411 [Holothuria leucospilota]|uniref:Uncharacterized protein n=1 Tax=Holothuria leucospilota TaxID=206669 RepID=A0A9Q0YJK4_HOLLE|nr:hypothetical protein HOLleu_37411 [Holothuria leucospilota]
MGSNDTSEIKSSWSVLVYTAILRDYVLHLVLISSIRASEKEEGIDYSPRGESRRPDHFRVLCTLTRILNQSDNPGQARWYPPSSPTSGELQEKGQKAVILELEVWPISEKLIGPLARFAHNLVGKKLRWRYRQEVQTHQVQKINRTISPVLCVLPESRLEMAWKLFLGAFSMMLVKLILADQGEYGVKETYGQNGNNYMIPSATNQQQEQRGLPPLVQSGYNERYDPQNYVPPPLTGQEQWQQPGSQLSNLQYNPNVGQTAYNQFSGQKVVFPPSQLSTGVFHQDSSKQSSSSNQFEGPAKFPPPVPPSLNTLYGQDTLALPGGNQLPTQKDVPPPVPPSFNAFYGQDALPPPGSNQFPTRNDLPPPVPPRLNALYGQDALPPPGSNRFPTQDDLPPPVPPSLNALYGQNALPPPGSKQFPTREDSSHPVPPSLNTLYGQDALPPPGSNYLPGANLPPPIPPSLNAFNDQSGVKSPENDQMYGLYGQPPVDPQIPHGSDDVAPLSNNDQFAPRKWQPPVLPDIKKAYGEDTLVPAPNSALYADKSGDSATNIGSALKSPNKPMDDYSPQVIIQDSGVEDESYDQEDEVSKQDSSDFGSSESLDAGYLYSSVLKGLGDFDADYSSESVDNNYVPLSVGNWNADSYYDSYGEPNQGEISEEGSFWSSYVLSSQELGLQVTDSEFVSIIIDKLQNGIPEVSRKKRTVALQWPQRPSSGHFKKKGQSSGSKFGIQDGPRNLFRDLYYYSSSNSESDSSADSPYSTLDAYASYDSVDTDSLNVTSNANSSDSDAYPFYDNSESDPLYNGSDAYPYYSYSYSAYSEYDDSSVGKGTESSLDPTSHITSNVNSSFSPFANLSNKSAAYSFVSGSEPNSSYSSYDSYPSYGSDSYSLFSDSDDNSSVGGSASFSGPSSESFFNSYDSESDDYSLGGGSASFPGPSSESYSYSYDSDSDDYSSGLGSASFSGPSSESYSYSDYSNSDNYSSGGGSASFSDTSSDTYSYSDSSVRSYGSNSPFSSDDALNWDKNISGSSLGRHSYLEGKDRTSKNDSFNMISSIVHVLMGNGKGNRTSESEFSSAENSNALPTDSSVGYLTATSSIPLLDNSSDEKGVARTSFGPGGWSSGFGSTNNPNNGESGHSHNEPDFTGIDVVTGNEPDQNKGNSESVLIDSTTGRIHQGENHAIDHTSFPPQGTAQKPSGTGNSAPKETAGLYPPRTKLRPMGSSSHVDYTFSSSLAFYCIPLVLLLLLIFLIRSNSYFRSTPKVVIVDPESRNRDIDAKAKEIEPLLRESMEYKDEVN